MTGLPVMLVLVLASLLPFAPALRAGFALDDGGLIIDNPAVWAASPAAAWTTPYWPGRMGAGLYRPWTTFSYWWNGKITGHSAVGFHAVNLLLNLAVVLLLHRALCGLFPARRRLALAAAILFAVHPLHCEAVVYVVGRAELWAALFGLGGWILAMGFVRRGDSLRLFGAATAFALAMLSKESAAGLLLLPILHLVLDAWSGPPVSAIASCEQAPADAAESPGTAAAASIPASDPTAIRGLRGRWLRVFGVWAIVLLGVAFVRSRVLPAAFTVAGVGLSDNALAHEPTLRRMANALGIQWLLGWRTAVPWTLTADASYPQIVPGERWMAAGAVLAAAAFAFAWWAVRRRDRELLWGAGIILAGGFVTSNIPVAVGTIYGERLAYLPSAGLIWLFVIVAARLSRHPSTARALRVLAIVWGVLLAGRSWARSLDWRDDLTLFRATTAASPRSAKAWTNLAAALLQHDLVPEALDASGRAVSLLPGSAGAREVHATALTCSGRAAEAVELLRPALRETSPRPRSLVELGNAWLALKQGTKAESAFVAAARILPLPDLRVATGLASAYALQERWRDAAAAWRQLAAQRPDDSGVQRSFAYALWQAGAPDSAEAIYRGLISRDDRDASSRNELAWLFARSGRNPSEAIPLARAAFRLQPGPDTADTLLEALLAGRGRPAARAWLDSLAAAPRPVLGLDAIRNLQDRWERHSDSR